MKIIVLIKAVPSHIANPHLARTHDRVAGKFGPLIINESDEYALEHAVVLAEESGGEVTVLSAGGPATEKTLVKGLAKGATRAVRVDARPLDPNTTATLLAEAAGRLDYDLILSGVESSDIMASQVGISTAERLGIPFVYSVREIKRGETPGTLVVSKELGGGITQIVEVKLPALLCVQACSIPLSLVSVTRLLRSRSKAVDLFSIGDLGLDETRIKSTNYRLIEVFRPQKNRAEFIEGSPDEIASQLTIKIEEAL